MSIAIAVIAGAALGLVFYGGLWLTVRRLTISTHPALLAIASFWGRTIIALAGFLVVIDGRWQNALACAAGFGIGRFAVSRSLKNSANACKGDLCT